MNHDTLTDGKRCGVPGKHEGITHPVIRGFKKKKKKTFSIFTNINTMKKITSYIWA